MKTLPHVQSFNGYNYLRYKGQPRVKLPSGAVDTPEFLAAYRKALAEAEAKVAAKPAREPAAKKSFTVGSLRSNLDRYFDSVMFKKLEPSTQVTRRRALNGWCDGNKHHGAGYATLPLGEITPKAFRTMMYALEAVPGEQRHFLCAVRHFLKECRKAQAVPEDFDPTVNVHCGRGQNPEGLKCWSTEYVEQYRRHFPSGTMARLAIEVLYHSGAACCDAIKLGRDNVSDGLIVFKRQKTDAESLPTFTPELEAEIAAQPVVIVSGPWLRNELGRPFPTGARFGERFRRWAAEAGIPKGYSAHGIRKRAATDDAEAGENPQTLMSVYGWSDMDQAAHYTRAADRKRAALARRERLKTRTNA